MISPIIVRRGINATVRLAGFRLHDNSRRLAVLPTAYPRPKPDQGQTRMRL
jgi:hypothetical protein